MLFGFVAMVSLLVSFGSERQGGGDFDPLEHQRDLYDQEIIQDIVRQQEQQNTQSVVVQTQQV